MKAVQWVAMAAVAAVAARLQLWLPFVTADPLASAVPFVLGGLFAVLVGWRAVPAVLVGTLAVGWWAGLPPADLGLAAALVVGPGAAAVALRRFAPPVGLLRSWGVAAGLTLILTSAAVRGLTTAGVWAVAGRPDPLAAGCAVAAVEWFVGMMVAPALCVWRRPPSFPRPGRYVELAALLFLTALVSQLVFGGPAPRPLNLPLPVLGGFAALFGWAALRFHVHGSAAVAAVTFAVLAGNAAARGSFAPVVPHAEPLALQVRLLTLVGGLVALQHFVAAVAGDRSGATAEVGRLHDELTRRNAELEAQAGKAARDHAFLEAVLAQLPVGVMIVGPDGRILQRNERHRQMFLTEAAVRLDDLPQGRMSTTTVRRVPFDRWPIVRAIQDGQVTEGYSARMGLANGTEVDVQISAGPVRGPGGQTLGAVSVMADVTERKRVVRQLRESEQKLRIALQSARMFVVEWATADGAVRAPQALAEWFRLPADACLTAVPDLLPFVHPEDAAGLADKLLGLMAGSPRCETVFRIRDRHGQVTWALSRSLAMTDEGGHPTGWVSSVLVDVTERYRQLDELRLLESAVVHARDAVVILEDKPHAGGGRSVLYANRAFTQMSGYEPHEVVGRSLHFLRGPNSDPVTLDRLRDALDDRRPFQCEVLNYRKDGTEYWVELSVVPVPDPTGACSHWVMIQRDVSDRKRADAELRHSREGLAEAQRIAHLGSWEYLTATGEVRWSDEKYRIFGYEPGAIVPTIPLYLAAVHPDDAERVHRRFDADRHTPHGEARQIDFRITRPSGEVRHIAEQYMAEYDPAGRLVRFHGVTQDVTERKLAQEQLIQAQKMELIGQMAGGIAHDFNNVLTGVIGNLDLVALPADDPNRRLIETATRAAFRATDMTKKLLGFARKSQLRIAPVPLAPVVAEVLEFVGRTTDPRIELRPLVRTAARVDGDFTLLSQVLLNLCLNARAAMPHGGRIEIRADEVDFPPAAPHPNGRTGGFVRLTVEDTGVGMPPEVLARVFEPFFTTKPVGEGTGLGLPMVHGIVEQHRGWVECTSEPGRGTRFDLFLPRSAVADDPPAAVERSPAVTPPPAVARGRKTVLLVDDEEMIRELARTVLQVNGYRVLEACDGEEALDLFQEQAADIDLVILDLTMPRLSGQDTFRGMMAIDPDARVLFSSGYSAETMADTDGVLGLLPKPYRPTDLLAAVDAALAAAPALATVS